MVVRTTTLDGPTRGEWLRALAIACTAVAFAPIWWGNDVARGFDRVNLAAAIVLAMVAAAVLFAGFARNVVGSDAGRLASWLLWPPALACGAVVVGVLSWTEVRSWGEGYADSLGTMLLLAVAHILALVVLGNLKPEAVAHTPASSDHATWRGGMALPAIVVLTACVRTMLQPAPEHFDRWFERLPRVGLLPAVEQARGGESREVQQVVGGIRLRRVCTANDCELRFATTPTTPRFGTWRAGTDAAEVRFDARNDVLVFRSSLRVYGFGRTSGARVNLRRRHRMHGHAPPAAWTLAALVGLASSVLLRVAVRRPPASLLRWRDAQHGRLSTDGRVTLEGAPPYPLPRWHWLAAGPVLVLLARRKHHMPFRDAGACDEALVASGTMADLDAALLRTQTNAVTLATTLATASCVPLLIEAMCQLAT